MGRFFLGGDVWAKQGMAERMGAAVAVVRRQHWRWCIGRAGRCRRRPPVRPLVGSWGETGFGAHTCLPPTPASPLSCARTLKSNTQSAIIHSVRSRLLLLLFWRSEHMTVDHVNS